MKHAIENSFTLPEGRTACRIDDVPVSTREFRRLQVLGGRSENTGEGVALDQIRGNVAEGCEMITVEKDKGPKAAKASALREHDVEKGFKGRIERIGSTIADRIIADFKTKYTVRDFHTDNMPSENDPFSIDDMQVPSMGWTNNDETEAPQSPSENMRENFLYELQRFVEEEVNFQMRELLILEFDGKSIWDNLRVKVSLFRGNNPKNVSTDVFFAETEEGE